MDLVRELLLKIEEAKEPPRLSDMVSEEDAEAYAIAAYHMQMLIREVGFVRGIDVSSNDVDDWIDLTLTWQGHEFLDAVRDPKVWAMTKEGAKKAGGSDVEFLFELAQAYVKSEAKRILGIEL
jgi:hypothetical protein